MMEGVSGFSGHWLEILAAVYLVGMVLYGHYRGFIRLCVSALALVISLVTVRVALPYVTEWLKNDTPVYESIRQGDGGCSRPGWAFGRCAGYRRRNRREWSRNWREKDHRRAEAARADEEDPDRK